MLQKRNLDKVKESENLLKRAKNSTMISQKGCSIALQERTYEKWKESIRETKGALNQSLSNIDLQGVKTRISSASTDVK